VLSRFTHRGYLDFERLYTFVKGLTFYVIRAKTNTNLRHIYSHPVEKATGVQCDQTVVLTNFYASQSYPDQLRRIRFLDKERDKRLIFLTNNFILPAPTIAMLYKQRWQVELFFKWIKQYLRIKAFYELQKMPVTPGAIIKISSYSDERVFDKSGVFSISAQ
jgi:IS4 transposase